MKRTGIKFEKAVPSMSVNLDARSRTRRLRSNKHGFETCMAAYYMLQLITRELELRLAFDETHSER